MVSSNSRRVLNDIVVEDEDTRYIVLYAKGFTKKLYCLQLLLVRFSLMQSGYAWP